LSTILLIVLQLAASGSDAFFTRRNATRPYFHELNPVARPFVSSEIGTVGYFAGGAAVQISIPFLLRKHGHRRLAETLALTGIADNAVSATYSATH
jgi:F420-0:gamma-glutamyl ligase-like protein